MPAALQPAAFRGRRPAAGRPVGTCRRGLLRRARSALLGFAVASALLSARGLVLVLAGAAGGGRPGGAGAAALTAEAVAPPATKTPVRTLKAKAKAKGKSKAPQTWLMDAASAKLGRRAGREDIIYHLTEDSEKGRFRADAELAFLPEKPEKKGPWATNEKDARQFAAKAVMEDPYLYAVLNKPVQDLWNLVEKLVKRLPKSDDVTYSVRKDPSESGSESEAGSEQYVATVHLGALPGNLSCEGLPKETETLARWAAAEAMLLNPEFQALSQPKLMPKIEPGAVEMLQMLVDKKLKRVVTKEDIVYDIEEREDMPKEARFRATLKLPFLKGQSTVVGKARPGWKRAKQAAAEAFLADPVLAASLSSDPVSALRSLVNKRLRRKSFKDDVVYTITTEPAADEGASPSYRAKVELLCLVGTPAREGEPCKNEGAAKRSAAEALLEDLSVQRLLSSRDPSEVLAVPVAPA